MRKTIIITLLVAVFGLFGVPGAAVAAGVGSDCGGCSADSNNENLATGIKLTKEAIEHAKQGHKKETVATVMEAKRVVKLIVSGKTSQSAKKSRAVYELDDARRRARDGKMDEAIAFMEKGLVIMGTIEPFE